MTGIGSPAHICLWSRPGPRWALEVPPASGLSPAAARRSPATHHDGISHTCHTHAHASSPTLPLAPLPVALDSHHREPQPSNLQPTRFPRAHSPITAMAMPLDTPAHALTQHSRPPVSVLIVPYVCARQLLRADPLSNKHWSVVRPPHPHALPSSDAPSCAASWRRRRRRRELDAARQPLRGLRCSAGRRGRRRRAGLRRAAGSGWRGRRLGSSSAASAAGRHAPRQPLRRL